MEETREWPKMACAVPVAEAPTWSGHPTHTFQEHWEEYMSICNDQRGAIDAQDPTTVGRLQALLRLMARVLPVVNRRHGLVQPASTSSSSPPTPDDPHEHDDEHDWAQGQLPLAFTTDFPCLIVCSNGGSVRLGQPAEAYVAETQELYQVLRSANCIAWCPVAEGERRQLVRLYSSLRLQSAWSLVRIQLTCLPCMDGPEFLPAELRLATCRFLWQTSQATYARHRADLRDLLQTTETPLLSDAVMQFSLPNGDSEPSPALSVFWYRCATANTLYFQSKGRALALVTLAATLARTFECPELEFFFIASAFSIDFDVPLLATQTWTFPEEEEQWASSLLRTATVPATPSRAKPPPPTGFPTPRLSTQSLQFHIEDHQRTSPWRSASPAPIPPHVPLPLLPATPANFLPTSPVTFLPVSAATFHPIVAPAERSPPRHGMFEEHRISEFSARLRLCSVAGSSPALMVLSDDDDDGGDDQQAPPALRQSPLAPSARIATQRVDLETRPLEGLVPTVAAQVSFRPT